MKHAKRLQSLMLGVLFFAASLPSWAVVDSPGGPAVRQMTFQPPVTPIAADFIQLHNWMMGICLAIFVGVFGVMFYSILKHRKSLGHKAASFHESTAVEIAWTVVPFIIKATGMQWKWGYDYLKGDGEGISFLSNLATPREQIVDSSKVKNDNYLIEVDNPVVVPVNKKVRIITTANDVIHSWTIPAFGVKQDAIPGFVRDTWFRAEKIGTYRGECVELCGKDRAFMPIVVKVVSDDDYKKWVDGKKKDMSSKADDPNKTWTVDELKQRGEKVYAANCVACHQANGKGVPNAFPALDGSAVVSGPKAANLDVVLNGKKSAAFPSPMPAWKGVLSDTDIAAVITYTRNTWSNKAQENIVQPAEVVAARK